MKKFKSKFFKFAQFAANSQGIAKGIVPVVVHRNPTSDMFGRFGKHK